MGYLELLGFSLGSSLVRATSYFSSAEPVDVDNASTRGRINEYTPSQVLLSVWNIWDPYLGSEVGAELHSEQGQRVWSSL
jgi:hypothetical protein